MSSTAQEFGMCTSRPADQVINNLHMLKQPLLPHGHMVKGRFVLTSLITLGSGFGQLWRAKDQQTKADVIVKLEITSPPTVLPATLPLEAKVLLQCTDSAFMLPLLADGELHVRKSTGPLTVGYIVMPQAGPDLAELQKRMPTRLFTIGTSFRLAVQMTRAIQDLHSRGWLHRDIKPGNFVLDNQTGPRPRDLRIFLIDFGMSGRWLTKGQHRPQRHAAGFYGSPRFASLHTHFGQDVSRRDDLWSLLYSTLWQVMPLPWGEMLDREQIAPEKRDKTPSLVKRHAALQSVYDKLLATEFYEEPDYNCIVSAFKCDLGHAGVSDDTTLDWQYQ